MFLFYSHNFIIGEVVQHEVAIYYRLFKRLNNSHFIGYIKCAPRFCIIVFHFINKFGAILRATTLVPITRQFIVAVNRDKNKLNALQLKANGFCWCSLPSDGLRYF